MTEILSLHTLCRCCHSDGTFKNLQSPYAYDKRIEVYSAMLKETLNITINPPPFEASYTICEHCITKLRDATYFKQQVIECEQKFEEYCKNEQALIIKEEIDYESSHDDEMSNAEENKNSSYNADETYNNCNEEKCDVKEIEIKINVEHVSQDNLDENYPIEIKQENEDTEPQSILIACNITDKPKARSPETILKKDVVKAKKRRKRTRSEVDSEFESCVKTDEGNVFICKTCDKRYKALTLLRKHIRLEHKDIYKCTVCSLQCVGRCHYIRHSKSHSDERDFKCHICGKEFRQKPSLQQHLNTHTKTEKFQCDICHKHFAYKQTLKKHIMWHYGANKTRICDICGHGFNDMANLNCHIRSVHEKQRPFKCHLCPKTFTAKKNLKAHSYFHTGEKPYKCVICADNFMSPWKLRQHQTKHHPTTSSEGQTKKLYTCKVCKLELDSRGKFMAHVRRHEGQKQYKCHLCIKDFTCKYSLNRHITTHSGIRPYGCDLCDKKYTQQSLLWRHKRRIHDPNSLLYSGRVVERVKCDLCNKSFKDINKHMVSHKKRPHICPFCSKSYPERNTLNRHILVVHQGLRRYPCNLCDKKYTKWTGLQRHTKKVHKLELKKEVEES